MNRLIKYGFMSVFAIAAAGMTTGCSDETALGLTEQTADGICPVTIKFSGLVVSTRADENFVAAEDYEKAIKRLYVVAFDSKTGLLSSVTDISAKYGNGTVTFDMGKPGDYDLWFIANPGDPLVTDLKALTPKTSTFEEFARLRVQQKAYADEPFLMLSDYPGVTRVAAGQTTSKTIVMRRLAYRVDLYNKIPGATITRIGLPDSEYDVDLMGVDSQRATEYFTDQVVENCTCPAKTDDEPNPEATYLKQIYGMPGVYTDYPEDHKDMILYYKLPGSDAELTLSAAVRAEDNTLIGLQRNHLYRATLEIWDGQPQFIVTVADWNNETQLNQIFPVDNVDYLSYCFAARFATHDVLPIAGIDADFAKNGWNWSTSYNANFDYADSGTPLFKRTFGARGSIDSELSITPFSGTFTVGTHTYALPTQGDWSMLTLNFEFMTMMLREIESGNQEILDGLFQGGDWFWQIDPDADASSISPIPLTGWGNVKFNLVPAISKKGKAYIIMFPINDDGTPHNNIKPQFYEYSYDGYDAATESYTAHIKVGAAFGNWELVPVKETVTEGESSTEVTKAYKFKNDKTFDDFFSNPRLYKEFRIKHDPRQIIIGKDFAIPDNGLKYMEVSYIFDYDDNFKIRNTKGSKVDAEIHFAPLLDITNLNP